MFICYLTDSFYDVTRLQGSYNLSAGAHRQLKRSNSLRSAVLLFTLFLHASTATSRSQMSHGKSLSAVSVPT